MNRNAMIGGILLMLLAGSMNVSAYHITGVPTALGRPANTWENPGIGGLTQVQCESDGPADPVNAFPESRRGQGGLCHADSGLATPGGFPPIFDDEPASTVWGKVQPTFTNKGAGILGSGFFIRIGNNNNACTGAIGVAASDEFLYKEVYAFWANNGYVTFFINEIGSAGSYIGATGLANPGAGYCSARRVTALV